MIKGKGFYIWVLSRCEGGDPISITRAAQQAGLSHVLIKVADGLYPFNEIDGYPPTIEYIDALRRAGITVWGWQYVYGSNPDREAAIAINRVKNLALDGFVVNAESEYKYKSNQAVTYMNQLRAGVPDVTLALSSFRFPSLHREFPWTEFLSRVDVNMPQVYWIGGTNPGQQLQRTVEEFQNYPIRPIIPTGAAFKDNSYVDPATKEYWKPTASQVQEFMDTCSLLGLDGYNFWEWGNTRTHCPDLWDTVSAQDTEYDPVKPELTTKTVKMGRVIAPAGLNLRAVPVYPGLPKWLTLPLGAEVEIIEEIQAEDGSTWWRVGQQQYCAYHWRSPFDGKFYFFAEYI